MALRGPSLLLLILALVVSSCDLRAILPVGIPLEYTSAGICSGVELTDNNGNITAIARLDPDSPKGIEVKRGQAVRIPDPGAGVTKYNFGRDPASASSQIAADVEWRCLPDKPPVRVQFSYTVGANPQKGLKITENAASPNGFDIVVQDFPK